MKNLLLLFFLISLCSCQTTFPLTNQLNELQIITNSHLNGKFKVATKNHFQTLDRLLFKKRWLKKTKDSITHVVFKLEYINEMRVSFFQNEKQIKSKILNGKLEGKYFVFKPKFEIPFFTLALNVFRSTTTRIGILENGNLILDSYGEGCGFLVVAPLFCTGGYDLNLEFEKLKK